MHNVREAVWENSKRGIGPCDGCPEAGSEFNHPGFFNPDADILIVEEAPSENHFNFTEFDRSNDVDWYRRFFEEEYFESIASWPPVELFIEPVFRAFDFDTEPPLIHVPHWGYYNTHHRLSDEQWDEVIQTTQNALVQTVFS